MKVLETTQLLLRPWTKEDASDVYAYAKSKKVGPMAGWKPHDSLEESEQIIDMFIKEDETLAIVLKETNTVIGSIGLHRDCKRELSKDKVRMLGYVLSEDYWGKGLMVEACEAIISYAFTELKLDLLSIYHFSFNTQSKRVIEKLGFSYEGTIRQASTIFDGTVYDDICYSMTVEEYKNSKK